MHVTSKDACALPLRFAFALRLNPGNRPARPLRPLEALAVPLAGRAPEAPHTGQRLARLAAAARRLWGATPRGGPGSLGGARSTLDIQGTAWHSAVRGGVFRNRGGNRFFCYAFLGSFTRELVRTFRCVNGLWGVSGPR